MLEWKPRLAILLVAAAAIAVALGDLTAETHGWLELLTHGW
jgi:hypothetical protein